MAWWLVGSLSALGGEDSLNVPVFSRDAPFLLISPFLLSLPRNFNKTQPDSLTLTQSLSVSHGFKALLQGLS